MSERKGKYLGPDMSLNGLTAIVKDDPQRGHVQAQFDRQRLPDGSTPQPGTGFDEQLPYCFGWHRFLESEFEFERTEGHGVDCRCLECWPEPHSLDQLRRRF